MIPRAKAQQELLEGIDSQIKSGKKWDDIAVISPKKGKNSWTFAEMYDAIAKDEEPENYGGNPIDSLLHYYEWKEKQGKHDD